MSEDLTAWVTQTASRALAYAITLVRHEAVAEDLVQDCYQRLLARAEHYNLPVDGEKLLFKAITNACINWTQRQRPHISLGADIAEPAAAQRSAADPVQSALLREFSAAVAEALAELPVTQRAAVELHSLGHSAAQIAEILNTTPGNVRVQLHRGRSRLSVRLKNYLEDPSEPDS